MARRAATLFPASVVIGRCHVLRPCDPRPRLVRLGARLPMPVLGAALLGVLAGCGSDSPTSPGNSPPKSVDVSALVNAASNGAYGGLARSLVTLPSYTSTPPANIAACPFSTADQLFECAPVTRIGITFKTSYQLLDAGGRPLSAADATTLAAVRTIIDVDGTSSFVSTSGIASKAAIHSHSDNTLSGLLTSQHTLNGSSVDHDTLTVSLSTPTTLAINGTTTIDKLDVPTKAGAYPATGTITSDATTNISAGSDTPFTTTIHASITFNGTSVVTITLGVGGTTQRCTLDLSNTSGLVCTST